MQFIGSTLFVMLPPLVRKRILDMVENAFGKLDDGLDLAGDLAGDLANRAKTKFE